jgi:hypothetical protein
VNRYPTQKLFYAKLANDRPDGACVKLGDVEETLKEALHDLNRLLNLFHKLTGVKQMAGFLQQSYEQADGMHGLPQIMACRREKPSLRRVGTISFVFL